MTLDPVVRDFAKALAHKQPCFSLSSSKIQILSEPADFYNTLLDMIRGARRRIFISSLYIGESEQELVDELHASLANNPALRLYLHLDYNRCLRPAAVTTVDLITPLLDSYPDRVHVSLFRSPSLRGIMARIVPPRLNEAWGTWHTKIYGVDDDVMISGANLNQSYFTDRQDRYVRFSSHPPLANYCFGFLTTASKFSYNLLSSTPSGPTLEWPDPETDPYYFEAEAESALTAFHASFQEKNDLLVDKSLDSDDEVLVFPVIQAGQFNIREEEECMSLLFKYLTSHRSVNPDYKPLVDLTSGYFNLYHPYRELILDSSVDCRIVAAGPKANGFYGASGASSRIPEAYTLLEQRFMSAVRSAGREWTAVDEKQGSGVELTEWEKDSWTYHCKGVWLSPDASSPPSLTLIGSTNLNARSAHLDTELSFFMITPSDSLRRTMQREVESMRQHAVPWRGDSRRIGWYTTFLAYLADGML